jgi:EmrB/QacA subfamily drug resistance transporter
MSQIGKPPCDEAVILHAAEAEPCSATTKRWVLVAAICGSSMAFVDGTVVNVALPAIQRDLNATASEAQWVVESYALFLAALLLVGGSLGDRVGRRRVFAIGIAIFAAASLGCALSADIHHLIAARAIQGMGAALLVPGSLALISASFPENERGRAIGTWSGFSGITAAIGPVLGGYLVDHYSWIWAFLINVPLAIVVLVIVWKRVPESRSDHTAGALDFWGAGLATVALGGIVYAFIEAPVQRWDSIAVLTALFIGLLAAASFVLVERKTQFPMLPLRLFRIRNFVGANVLTLLLYAALGGGLFFFPLNLVQAQGYSASAAGAALLPFILIMFALSRWAGALVDRIGSKLPLVLGPTIAAAGFALFALPGLDASYWTGYFPAVVVLGLGMAVTVAPLTTTVMNSVGVDMSGVASGINNAVARAAALLAIAIFGMVMARVFELKVQERLDQANVPAEARALLRDQGTKQAAVAIPSGLDPSMAAALRHAVEASFVAGFRWIMLLSAFLALSSALAAWFSIGNDPRNGGRQKRANR